MVAQDDRLKANLEALVNMKVLQLCAWETHSKNLIEKSWNVVYKWLSSVLLRRAYNILVFWSFPILVSAATLICSLSWQLLNLIQEPITSIPDVIGLIIFNQRFRCMNYEFPRGIRPTNWKIPNQEQLGECELQHYYHRADFSWEELAKPSLRNIDLQLGRSKKVAVCREVGSGKPSLLAAILGKVHGNVSC